MKTDKRFVEASKDKSCMINKGKAIDIFQFWNFVGANFKILTKHRTNSNLVKKGIKKVEKLLIKYDELTIKRSIMRYNKLLSLSFSKINKSKIEATTSFLLFFGFDSFLKNKLKDWNNLSIDLKSFKSWFVECMDENVYIKYSIKKIKVAETENKEYFELFILKYKDKINNLTLRKIDNKMKYANSFSKIFIFYNENSDKFNKLFINSFYDFLEIFFEFILKKYSWFSVISLDFIASKKVLEEEINNFFEEEDLWR